MKDLVSSSTYQNNPRRNQIIRNNSQSWRKGWVSVSGDVILSNIYLTEHREKGSKYFLDVHLRKRKKTGSESRKINALFASSERISHICKKIWNQLDEKSCLLVRSIISSCVLLDRDWLGSESNNLVRFEPPEERNVEDRLVDWEKSIKTILTKEIM